MWGCFLMSGVKILHFLKDWWKSIPIHQNYTMALSSAKKQRFLLQSKGEKCCEITRGQFLKITEIDRLQEWEIAADKNWYDGYITRHLNSMNSYWLFWIGRLHGACSVSSFCDFQKTTFAISLHFSPFWHKQTFVFSDVLIREYFSFVQILNLMG